MSAPQRGADESPPNGVPFEWDDLDGPIRVLSEGWSE